MCTTLSSYKFSYIYKVLALQIFISKSVIGKHKMGACSEFSEFLNSPMNTLLFPSIRDKIKDYALKKKKKRKCFSRQNNNH